MKTRRLLLIMAGIAGMFLASCTEKIDIKLDNTYTRLVVDGTLTDEAKMHTVRLTMTTNYYYNQPAPPVTGANVTLTDGQQTITLTEIPSNPGTYGTPAGFAGVPGKTYTLHISLAEAINGNADYEASSALPPVNPVDSIRLEYMSQYKLWIVDCYAQDPPEENFYMFKVIKNGVLMSDTLSKVNITDDQLFNGSYTNGIGVAVLRKDVVRETVNPGDTITLMTCGITKDYLNFIMDVMSNTGFQNPMFGGPPANIRGNVDNGAMGFFAAYSVNYKSTVYHGGK